MQDSMRGRVPSANGVLGTSSDNSIGVYLSQFSESTGYVNFSSVGPLSKAVMETGYALDGQFADAGPDTVENMMAIADEVSAKIAPLIGRRPDEVVMQPNTSEGLFHVAFSLPKVNGHVPRVLVSRNEFPANYYPWKRAEEAGLLQVWSFEGPASAENLIRQLDGIDVVALSAVDYQTGYRADLSQIREVIGNRLMVVDGIQGFGASDNHWNQADVLLVGGQKWLRAGWGTGFMACSPRAMDYCTRPLLSGWSGAVDAHDYDGTVHLPMQGAAAFSMTKLSPMEAGRLGAAIDLFASVGVDWISDRIQAFANRLDEDVSRLGGRMERASDATHRSNVLPISFEGKDVSRIGAYLHNAGVTCTVHPRTIRITPHATSTTETYELLVKSIGEAVKQG